MNHFWSRALLAGLGLLLFSGPEFSARPIWTSVISAGGYSARRGCHSYTPSTALPPPARI